MLLIFFDAMGETHRDVEALLLSACGRVEYSLGPPPSYSFLLSVVEKLTFLFWLAVYIAHLHLKDASLRGWNRRLPPSLRRLATPFLSLSLPALPPWVCSDKIFICSPSCIANL